MYWIKLLKAIGITILIAVELGMMKAVLADETELVENEVLAWAEKREQYRRKRCEDAKGDTEVD